jgi:hypothetical protein
MALEPFKEQDMEMNVKGISVKKIKIVGSIILVAIIILVIKR